MCVYPLRILRLDPELGRFITEDPIKDGQNWYIYVSNNPLRFIDPSGLNIQESETLDGEDPLTPGEKERDVLGNPVHEDPLEDLSSRIKEMEDLFGQYFGGKFGDPYSPENKEKIGELHGSIMDLYGQYNRELIKSIEERGLKIEDYLPGGRLSEAFGVPQDLGDYQTNAHPAIDVVGVNDLTSPFYTQVGKVPDKLKGSNPFDLEIIGTDLKIRVLHADIEDVAALGDIYKPGKDIIPFPEHNNSTKDITGEKVSTGAHLHIQISDGNQFYNPMTLEPGGSNFQYTRDGGNKWIPFQL